MASPPCGLCRKPLRGDESLTRLDTFAGSYQACPRCVAKTKGTPQPPDRIYHENWQVPHGVSICGICRRALWDDDSPEGIRLAPADVVGLSIQSGQYQSCRECVDFFRPIIAERLGVPVALATGNRLLTLAFCAVSGVSIFSQLAL